jgi:hypothetical protein
MRPGRSRVPGRLRSGADLRSRLARVAGGPRVGGREPSPPRFRGGEGPGRLRLAQRLPAAATPAAVTATAAATAAVTAAATVATATAGAAATAVTAPAVTAAAGRGGGAGFAVAGLAALARRADALGRASGSASSTSGNDRCRRGGTRSSAAGSR